MNLIEIINKIEELKKELEHLRPIKPDYEKKIWHKFRLDWNFHSNHIEGNSLTFGETKLLLETGHISSTITKPKRDYDEIVGHDKAIDIIIQLANEKTLLTEAIIRELHKTILPTPYMLDAQTRDGKPTKRPIMIGEYKKYPNHVLTSKGKMFYFTTPEETKPKMSELVDTCREKKGGTAKDVLLLVSEFHYKFVLIHPFDDGNGRIARLLLNYFLLLNEFPPIIIRTDDKKNYFTALEASDAGNFESLVIYIGEQLIKSLELIIKGAKGEEVEEAEDVDKEITLLRIELDNIGQTELKRSKTKYNFERVLKNSIQPLVEICFLELSKLNPMFKMNRIYFSVDNAHLDLNASQIIPNGFTDELIKLNKLFNQLDIYFEWKDFNNPAVPSFDYNISVKCYFSHYYYFIEDVILKTKINKKYYEDLEQEEIRSFVKSILKNSIKLIKDRVNKEKRPGL